MGKNATFVSVWDDGDIRIETGCEVDLKTGEVYNIEKDRSYDELVENLDEELIILDGEEYPVAQEDEFNPSRHRFWYR